MSRYGLQKEHYSINRSGVTYPIVKHKEGFFEYGVIDYHIEKRLPRKCPFDVISYDGYSMHLRTDRWETMDDLPRSMYLCPQGMVMVEIDDDCEPVGLSILEPAYYGLGEWSEWPDVVHVLSAIEDSILEQKMTLDIIGKYCEEYDNLQ